MNLSTASEIPTLSFRPMHESIKNSPSIDDLYVERKNLQREWAQFLKSMGEQVVKNNESDKSTTIENINEESSDIAGIENNTLKHVMLQKKTDTRLPDRISPADDYEENDKTEAGNEQRHITCVLQSEDKEGVMITFQSLNEQVNQLRGILDSIGNLPLSSTNRSFKDISSCQAS
eukprot:CAMPEP_0168179476 /NCGR_PEP_ID=MMETSP0139_2-20121125/9879_1 /TAXON_ID=44445 /ORGANISM="Pseudo-nitzschia australis, Strain 10249 10 AB" /LENGTH=174 /DNA_ID=CAMNT_0008099339 /DNA_START=244 /DNA_END=768 /DNA_ORIENTATION=-